MAGCDAVWLWCRWDFIASMQITKFPIDAVTSSGDKFWSGTKRFPTPLTYDPTNEYHVLFVTAGANILAAAYGLVPPPEQYVQRV